MKVYIVLHIERWEGSYIHNIYSTYEKALEEAKKENENYRSDSILVLDEKTVWPEEEVEYWAELCPVCTDMEGYVVCWTCNNTKLISRFSVVKEGVYHAVTIQEWEVE